MTPVRLDQPLGQREAVHLWHHDIGHQQVNRSAVVRRQTERLVAGASREHLILLTLEEVPQERLERRVILDD